MGRYGVNDERTPRGEDKIHSRKEKNSEIDFIGRYMSIIPW